MIINIPKLIGRRSMQGQVSLEHSTTATSARSLSCFLAIFEPSAAISAAFQWLPWWIAPFAAMTADYR